MIAFHFLLCHILSRRIVYFTFYINLSNYLQSNCLLQSLFDTVQDYYKLERIEISGLKAKSLLYVTNDIYEEFVKLYQQFGDVSYETLMPEEEQFTTDLREFFAMVSNLFTCFLENKCIILLNKILHINTV